jgi:hypothetical protein
MAQEKFSEYTQKLYDTVLSLHKEVDSLRITYGIVHKRNNAIANLVNRATAESAKEAVNTQEIYQDNLTAVKNLSLATELSCDSLLIKAAHQALKEVEQVYEMAKVTATINKDRKNDGGNRKSEIHWISLQYQPLSH